MAGEHGVRRHGVLCCMCCIEHLKRYNLTSTVDMSMIWPAAACEYMRRIQLGVYKRQHHDGASSAGRRRAIGFFERIFI